MTKLFYTLLYLSVFSPTIPLITVLINRKNLKKSILIAILFLPLLSLTSDLLSWWFVKRVEFQFAILHVYTFLAGSTLFYYFYHLFEIRRYFVLISQLIFTSFCILSTLFWGGLYQTNTVPNITLNIFVITFSLAYFVKAINELKFDKITHDIHFWLNFALLLLYGTTLFFSLFETYLRQGNPDINQYTWPILYIANIMFNAILTIGIWKTRRIL